MRKLASSLVAITLLWAGNAAADPPAPQPMDPTATGPQQPAVSPTGAATTTTTTTTQTPVATGTVTTQTTTPPAPVPVGSTTTTSADTEALQQPPPPPADVPAPESTSWVNRPLLVTGGILLVGSYVPMAAIAYTSDRPADQTNLYYPVVGPWMNLADRQCDIRSCNNEGLNKALLIADGIGQGLGALAVVTSFFLPNSKTKNWYLIGDDKTHAGPTRVGTGYGLGAAGHF